MPSGITPYGSNSMPSPTTSPTSRAPSLPEEIEHWSLTTLREKLVKIGARIVRHGRYVVFQLAEVAVPRALFAEILRRIDQLRPKSTPLAA
jgi:Transposase DDE domain group 1